METSSEAPKYRIWGADNVAYGPVELTTLTSWVLEERVTAESWVFAEEQQAWVQASRLPELSGLLRRKAGQAGEAAAKTAGSGLEGISIGALRRIKLLADMEAKQLESFVRFMEVVEVRQFAEVVRRGDHGDSMYMVIEGELRARILVDGRESTLSTIQAGGFFGELSLLDAGPRSADVLANTESRLLRISAGAFDRLMKEAPALAAVFLHGLARSVGARVRGLTQRYQDAIHFSRLGSAV